MTQLVVDAAFAGAWILPDERSKAADRTLRTILSGERELAVPDLWIYEMTNLVLSAHRRGRLDEEQIFEAHRLIDSIPRRSHDHDGLLARERISRLALRFDLSGYDASYLELADRLQCCLVSSDNDLSKAARSLGLPG